MSTIIVQNAHQKCLELHNIFFIYFLLKCLGEDPQTPQFSLVIPKGVFKEILHC